MPEQNAQPETRGARRHIIELKLQELNQLFNSMDPAPFHAKDLDRDAEEFIVSWAQEFPLKEPVALMVHLERPCAQMNPDMVVRDAVHNFFQYEADLKRRELKWLLARGRTSLFIGLVFLAACVAVGTQIEARFGSAPGARVIQESLLIGGWVAMWGPMEIFLYDWWPIRGLKRLFDKLSRMDVGVTQP